MNTQLPVLPYLESQRGSGGWLCGKWLSSHNPASCSAAGKCSHKTVREREGEGESAAQEAAPA